MKEVSAYPRVRLPLCGLHTLDAGDLHNQLLHWYTCFLLQFEYLGHSRRSAQFERIQLFLYDLDSFLRLVGHPTLVTVDLPEKASVELLKAQLRSWPDMLQRLHIAMKVRLIDGHLAEESESVDIGLSCLVAKKLRRLEVETHSLESVDSSDSLMPSAMVVRCYCLELDK